MSGKFIGGVVVAILLIGLGALAFGVFEETNDGPIENAVESVDDAIK